MAAVAATLVAIAAEAPVRAESSGGTEAASAQALLNGYRRYNSSCNHCHGPDGIGGSFAPPLIEQPLPYPDFRQIVERGGGSGVAVMRGFADDPNVAPYIRDIWLYLEARAGGSLGRGRPTPAP